MPKLSEFNVLTTAGLDNTIIPIIELNSQTNNRNKNILISDLRTLIFNATKASAQTLGAVRVGNSLTIDNNGILNIQYPIPDQATNGGKVLTTNGTTLSWQSVTEISIAPASTTVAGIVKIDGSTITIDQNNVISANVANLKASKIYSPNLDYTLSVTNLGTLSFEDQGDDKFTIDFSIDGFRITNLTGNNSLVLRNDGNLSLPGTIHEDPQDITGFDASLTGIIDLGAVESSLRSSVLYINPIVNTDVTLPSPSGVFGNGKRLTIVNQNQSAVVTVKYNTDEIFDILPDTAKQVVSDGFSWKALSSAGGNNAITVIAPDDTEIQNISTLVFTGAGVTVSSAGNSATLDISGGGNTGDFTFNNNQASVPISTSMILLTQNTTNGESKLTLSPTGESSLYAANLLEIGVNYGSGFEKYWKFTANGSINFPDGSVQSSAYTGVGAGGVPRNSAGATTTSIANNATANITIPGYKSYMLMSIYVDNAAWVRIYTDTNSRLADASRLEGTDPLPGAGVIAEVITTGPGQTIMISPAVLGFNNESPPTLDIPVAVTNKSGVTQAIDVVLTLLQLES